MVNKRPTSRTNIQQDIDASDITIPNSRQGEILDIMDIGDLDNNPELLEGTNPHQGSASTVKRRHAASKGRSVTATVIEDQDDDVFRTMDYDKNAHVEQDNGYVRTKKYMATQKISAVDAAMFAETVPRNQKYKPSTGMKLSGNKGYFISNTRKNIDYSQAVSLKHELVDDKSILGYGTMKVVRGEKTVVASYDERKAVENHIRTTQNNIYGSNHAHHIQNDGINPSEVKIKAERMNFLTHLMTGEPIDRTKRNDIAVGSLEIIKTQLKPGDLNIDLEDHGNSLKDGSPSDMKGSSPGLRSDAVSHVNVRNKSFFDRILDQAARTRENDRVNAGRNLDEDEDESKEESIKDAEVDNEIDPDESVHSIHDSVQFENRIITSKELDLQQKMASIVQRLFRTKMKQTEYMCQKEALIDAELFLISRHFKNVEYRKSFGHSETLVNFVVTFKMEKKYSASDMEEFNRPTADDQINDMVHPLALTPILHISLINKRNFLINCNGKIDLEKYMVDRSKRAMLTELTAMRLSELCRQLLESMFVVDDTIHFHRNLTSLINSPIDLENVTVQERSTEDEDAAEVEASKPVSSKAHQETNRFLKDGCIFDIGRASPVSGDSILVMNETKLKYLIYIQRRVKDWFKRQVAYYKDTSSEEKAREIKFSGLAKKDNHYVNIICLINKHRENRAEVHAFDFNELKKLKHLDLEEKVLYTKDLNVPDIFRKVELDFRDNRVEITEFNKYQMKQARILDNILRVSPENLYKLTRLQANVKGMIRRRHYKIVKEANDKQKYDKVHQKILTRYFSMFNKELYMVLVEKNKYVESIIKIKAVKLKSTNKTKDKVESLELYSNYFRNTDYQIESYAKDLKSRLFIKKDLDTLDLKLDMVYGDIEKEYNIMDSKAYEEETNESAKDDHVTNYLLNVKII